MAHKAYIVIQCEPGQFYIDHVVPFGVTSRTGLQGAVMDAIVDILDRYGWGPNLKWVDDLNNFRLPTGCSPLGDWNYGHDLACIFWLAERLGITRMARIPPLPGPENVSWSARPVTRSTAW